MQWLIVSDLSELLSTYSGRQPLHPKISKAFITIKLQKRRVIIHPVLQKTCCYQNLQKVFNVYSKFGPFRVIDLNLNIMMGNSISFMKAFR